MQCNINRKGRLARLISGLLCLGIAAAAMILYQAWIAGGLLAAAGIFQVIEATLGWCVMRAMGFRTPM